MEDIFSGYPILKCVQGNKLTRQVYGLIHDFAAKPYQDKAVQQSLIYFICRQLDVFKISARVQSVLADPVNFQRDKSLLYDSGECSGVLLFEQIMYPELGEASERYPFDVVFYSWLSHAEHDRVSGLTTEEKPVDREGRTLLLLPLSRMFVSMGTDVVHMLSDAEDYGSFGDYAQYYSKIHDMVMSFILLDNFKEVYDEVLFEQPLKRSDMKYGKNLIQVLE